ncbi:ISWI chromatin-remodeling complex ATPase ISW2 [Nannizzia gypsea CBS 118893]|uniref:ISWI chromatin-remodeling complex ATPase ISW2 n=1 Tax=Arthroderma gypseum (strain ATCC MYA-4604 / CBS 118893) TaxID=535722 RepID=E4UTL1_ARTGP|nr:ISWI chromatin-remodeling complex ATPase ISW2 [Nannizzia gypsea CBS 118893]EFR00720.1 ISWI chromatin-remodeling complex ATPase ISW2 [Nannizzia gypsea CBS 118893]
MEADPFFWSIDEVVTYLCHGSFNAWARSSLPRPDPIQLESHLRENYVTGEVLLTEVDREALPRYLGLKALGHQATVFKAIQYLRSRSTEFRNGANSDFSSAQNAVVVSSPARIGGFTAPPVAENRSIPTPLQPSCERQAPLVECTVPQPVESTPKIVDPPAPQQKGGDGKKRRRLNPSALSTQSLTNVPENPCRKRYLCFQKHPVKDVFYKGIESDDDNDTFGYVRPANSSTGESRFVNKRMLHFLQQVPQPFPEDKEGSLAIFPYDESTAPNVPRYFTLYKKNNGRVNVRVEEASKWPHLNEQSALDYLTVKYPPQSEELPLYGESGSEDYDSETCRDMDEARDDDKSDRQDGASSLMSAADLNTIVDEFITNTIEKWKDTKLPIHERTAYALWRKSRKAGTVSSDIRRAKAQITHLDTRLASWIKGIKSNEYENGDRGKVLRQCASLEVTVTQREIQRWRVSVLELEICPSKPTAPLTRQRAPRPRFKDNDEESIGSDTDEAIESDPDFVVSDDTHIHTNGKVPSGSNTNVTPIPSSIPEIQDTQPPSDSAAQGPMGGPFEDVDVVDLTEADMEGEQDVGDNDADGSGSLDIHTPPLNPTENPKDGLEFSPRAAPVLSDTVLDHSPPDAESSELPDVTDIAALNKVSWKTVIGRGDRKRLLAKTIYTLSKDERAKLTSLLSSVDKSTWRRRLREALKAIQKETYKISSITGEDIFLYKRMATLYVSWLKLELIQNSVGIPTAYLKEARRKDEVFPFYNDLTEILRVERPKSVKRETSCEIISFSQNTSRKGSTPAIDPIIIEDEDDEQEPLGREVEVQEIFRSTPRKKRKRAVAESKEAMETQSRAQRRVEEQATRQRMLQEEGGIENDDPEKKIVSFDDPVICLHRDIGRRVKEHQISGIQFMWRELIKDEKNEGCLLAHTMGLGKTMQVISLLVTIANASNSSDPKIKAQVPERFRTSRTLITCPASLIDNWDEEFAKWTPPDAATRYNLGQVRKIVSQDPIQRLYTINGWYTEGGVLLISHELLRRMIHYNAQKAAFQRLPAEKCEIIKRQLLDGPNIVVADEAHKLKNGASNLSKACTMFKSKSRIALTGSPLSNQLIDYYQMINWISPGYLGTLKQFKAKYEEPIREGLYFDSTNAEYVKSRKKLEVLKKVLEPKVNRAGVSVIQKDLPSKVEFVIYIPPTPLQKETYNQFVSLTMEGKGEFEFTRLWVLLSYLTLLCHHPSCFLRRILEKKKERSQVIERENAVEGGQGIVIPSESEPEANPDSPTAITIEDDVLETEGQTAITDEVVSQFEQKFKGIKSLDSPENSHRTQMVGRIVDESIKTGDKVLIFSGYLHTLTYLGSMLEARGQKFCRLDGKTPIATRQTATKNFSDSDAHVYLISTKAGALGLNIIGANRVIIFESEYNPTWEEQAIGRAYRLGQAKDVFVYRFVMGGTFEELIHEKGVFKKNMALRAVDKKNPTRSTGKSTSEFRRPIQNCRKQDLSEFQGKDPKVLDKILAQPNYIHRIILTETLHREDAVQFTPQEKSEIQAELDDERLERTNPELWAKKQHEKRLAEEQLLREEMMKAHQHHFPVNNGPPFQPATYTFPMQSPVPFFHNSNGVNTQHMLPLQGPVPRLSQPQSQPQVAPQIPNRFQVTSRMQFTPRPPASFQGRNGAVPLQTLPAQPRLVQAPASTPISPVPPTPPTPQAPVYVSRAQAQAPAASSSVPSTPQTSAAPKALNPASITASTSAPPGPPGPLRTQPTVSPSVASPTNPHNPGRQGTEPRSTQPPPLPPLVAQFPLDPKPSHPHKMDKGTRGK